MDLTGKILICKNQEDYDRCANTEGLFTTKHRWNVDLAALMKYIRENNLKSGEVTEDIINQFIIE